MEVANYSDIEQLYEKDILPQYAIHFGHATWNDHGKIGEDTFAHYFTASDKKYVLVFEDFPSQSHFIAEDSEFISVNANQKWFGEVSSKQCVYSAILRKYNWIFWSVSRGLKY